MNDFDFSSAIDEEAKRQAPPLGAPMPATPQMPDPFAAGIEAEAQRQTALRQSIIPAIQIDPQRAARLNAMSKTTGLPVDLIERQEQSVEQLLILDKMDALASQHPKLGQALTNPAFARVAHQEAEQLGFLERQAEAAKSGWSSGMASRKTTELVVALDNLKRLQEVERKLAAGEYLTPMDRAFAAMTPDVRAETIAGLERKATALRLESAAFSKEAQDAARKMNPAVQQALNAKSMGEFWEGFKVAPLELLAALPIQSMTQNPVAAVSMAVPIVGAVSRTAGAAMALAGAAGVATAGAATEYGAAVLESLADAGVDTTDPKAILAAVQNDKLMEDVRQAALVKSSVITAFDMASMGVAAKVFNPGRVTGTNIASKVAKEAGNVVVQAGIQGAMGGAGEVLGSVAAGGEVQAGAVMAEILGGGAGAIGNVALMSGVRAREELAAATRSTETLKALMTSVEAIKLRTADPEQFRQFAESIVSEGADTVYVDGGILSQAANSSPEAAAIIALMPAVQAQMDQAQVGTDVLIPTADLLTYIAGTPLAEALLPHLRTNVSALSVTDAQERLAAAAKAIEGAQEQDAQREAFQASQKAVADSIMADIVATGTVPRDQARVQAALAANMFAVLAGKLGTTPEAVYSEMYPLNIQGERPTATQQWNELVADLNDALGRADETQARRARLKLEAIRPAMEQERAARAAVRQPTDTIPTLDAEGRPLTAAPDVPRETEPLAAGTFEAVPEVAAEEAPAAVLSQDAAPAGEQTGDSALSQDTGAGREVDRGQISFGRGVGVDGGSMRLLSGADFSSFLHELSHFYLEVLADIASKTNAPETATQDLSVVLDWFGIVPESAGADRGAGRSVQSIPDRLQLDAQFVSDLLVRGPGATQIDGALSIEPLLRMLAQVAEAVDDPEVLQAVVASLPVDVVNVLGGEKASAERALHDPAMLQLHFTGDRSGNVSVPIDRARALVTLLSNTAREAAKRSDAGLVAAVANRAAAETGKSGHGDTSADSAPNFTALDVWRGMTLEQKRPFHEKFARGAEAYFFEGRAPTKELRGVFSRVRSWMMGVYRSLVDLGVPLTDEVRGVFDRMLASNNQLQEAAEGRAYTPIFKSAAEAGMTEAEFQAYMDSGMDQTRTALEELHGRSLADMQWLSKARGVTLKRLQREAKEKRDAVEAEVRLEILAEPLQLAIRFIKTGEVAEETMGRAALAGLDLLADGASRLSTAALREIYGEGPAAVWRYLPTNMKQTDGGAHPDTVASVFGFSSGDEMVRAIVADGPIDDRVQAETDARMLERYGDLATPEAMEAAVDQALQNTAHIRFLATEIATMQDMLSGREQTGTTTVRRGANKGQQRAVTVNAVVEAAKRWAEQIVGRTKVRDLAPRKYTVAANRAAKKAEALWAAGNRIQAADAKRDQILNARTARESAKARDEAEKIVAHLRTLANKPSDKIAVEYRLQILAMLERFEFRAMSRRNVDRATSLAAYLTKMAEAGVEPVISDKLRDEAFRTNYLNLTVAELRELDEAVKSLEATGRRLSKLRTAKGDREAQAAIDEAVESIRENGGDVRARQYEPTGRVTRLFRGFLAEHRKFASILRQLDGNKDNGILWQLLGRTVNEAADREAAMREQSTEALVKILAPVMGLGLGQKVHIPSINASLTRAGRLAVALNHGNEGNRQRVRDGHGWTEGQVADILATLSREEWTAVQAVWDHIDSYWPAIVEKTKRLNGLPPEKVEADAFTITFPDGSTLALRGGYYPAKASTELSSRAAGHDLAEQASNMMQGAYTASTTRRGHLKERAEASKQPIELSLDPLFTHVNNVTHDLAFHEWLIDANRILRDSKIDRAIRDHYPAETLSIIKEAIKDIAVGDTATMTNTEKMLMRFRGNVSAAVMGWSLTTSLLQPFGLAQSIVRIGPKWVFKGLGDALMSTARLENAMTAIREESSFMRLRAKTFNRELNEIHGRIRAGRSTNLGGRILTGYENSLFVLMQKMQLIADVPTWLGAKEKALAEGADAETAVALADQAVIDSQGSGMIKDLSGIQRGGTGLKILTMFYSYFNTTYNLTAESVSKRGRQLSEGQYLSAAAGFAADMTLLYVIPALAPALLIAMMRGEEIEDDEWAKWLAKKQLGFALGTMVGVREFSGLLDGYAYAGPPALRIVSDVGKVGVQVAQGKVDEALVRSVVNLTGDAFGIPVTQIQRTVRGWLAWEEGDAPPTSILFGPPPRN